MEIDRMRALLAALQAARVGGLPSVSDDVKALPDASRGAGAAGIARGWSALRSSPARALTEE